MRFLSRKKILKHVAISGAASVCLWALVWLVVDNYINDRELLARAENEIYIVEVYNSSRPLTLSGGFEIWAKKKFGLWPFSRIIYEEETAARSASIVFFSNDSAAVHMVAYRAPFLYFDLSTMSMITFPNIRAEHKFLGQHAYLWSDSARAARRQSVVP